MLVRLVLNSSPQVIRLPWPPKCLDYRHEPPRLAPNSTLENLLKVVTSAFYNRDRKAQEGGRKHKKEAEALFPPYKPANSRILEGHLLTATDVVSQGFLGRMAQAA